MSGATSSYTVIIQRLCMCTYGVIRVYPSIRYEWFIAVAPFISLYPFSAQQNECTPLHYAALYGHPKVVTELVRLGAKMHEQDMVRL